MLPKRDSNTAQQSLALCSLFESEILVWLTLSRWEHPLADDCGFRSDLIESATEVLRTAAGANDGRRTFMSDVPDCDMNFIAAICYSEHCALESAGNAIGQVELEKRRAWLDAVRRTLPSCFCSAASLPPNLP